MLKNTGKLGAAVLMIWLFLQGLTQIWGGFSQKTIPQFLIEHNLLAVSVNPEIIGWGSLAFGAALTMLLLAQSSILNTMRSTWRNFRNPRSVDLEAQGGREKASLQLRHRGEPSIYKIEGRIESMLGEGPNPAPQAFNAEIQPGANHDGAFECTLVDGQFAHVIVADLRDNRGDWGGSITFQIRRGKYNSTCVVPDSGAILLYSVKASHATIDKRFRVARNLRDNLFIDIEEVF